MLARRSIRFRWEITGEEQAPVTFGCDAHDVLSVYDNDSFHKAMEMVMRYQLNYIGRPALLGLQNIG